MPEITDSSILDVRLGTQMAGALMVGTREIYVRHEKHSFSTPGNFSFTLPDWATAYGVVMSGGGGGGEAGSNANGSDGKGGRGGDLLGVWGQMSTGQGRVLSGTIGAGGAGGSSAGAYGQRGGTTTLITHDSDVFSAAGGTGNPTAPTQKGGVSAVRFSVLFSRYINIPLNSTYTNGPAGTGNGGSGTRGGGGAGGNGGIFGKYTRGGSGGNGYVDIYVWGLPRNSPGGTVEITLGTDIEAREQLRDALSTRGLNYQTVEEIPFDIKLVGTGSVLQMFYNCKALRKAPPMDTWNVTNMNGLFRECAALTSVPPMDTSRVTNMYAMFHSCYSLTSVAPMETSKVTNADYMFYYCNKLTDRNVRLNGRHSTVSTSNMIDGSGLTRKPFYDSAGNPI